jgi:hypothetical protein
MAWELQGNPGTNPVSNFLGTTDGKQLVIQPGSGNVGIGTTNPDTRLNINSNAPNAQAVLVVSDKNADTRVGLWSGFSAGGNSPAIIYTHDLRFGIGQDFSNGADFSEAVRITREGKIGIGTEHPSSMIEIAAQDGLSVTGFQPFITLRDANAGNARSVVQGVNGDIVLIPNSFIGGGAAMVLQTGSGNVGIGTSQPGERLHVVGDAHIQNSNIGTGVGLVVEASLNSALSAITTAPASTAFFVIQEGNGHIMVGRKGNAEVFRVTNSGDVQVRGALLTCDINAKDNFSCVSARGILERLAGMQIREWNYKTDPISVRHIGPTSQDFQAAFELNGDDETNISSVDAQGVALAAIQGLNEKLNTENAQLRTSLANLERRLAALESNLSRS